ncbi:MAG: hypothetical protein GX577_01310 [Leptolinea sp.]|nr:hypothetical protein [Leptolinea sp.]
MHQLFFQAIPSSTPAKKTIPQSPPTNTPTPRTLLQKGPTKTPTFVNPQNKNPSQGRKQTKVSVNWDNIDVADLVIDVVGLLGDIAIIKPPEGSIGWVITEVIEGASLVKTAYDMCNANPTNATLYTLESEFKYILLVARAERLVPHVGWIGNLVSLGINIIPNTKIE